MWLSPDVRGSLRSLGRSPGFTVVAALTLGLGAGAMGAVFTLLRQVVLEPLPVRDESSVVVAWGNHLTRDFDHFPFSHDAWQRISDGAAGVDGLAATDASGARERLVEVGDGLTPMRWSRVLGDLFGVLGVPAVVGRPLDAQDDETGGARVAMVSWGLWQRRWGGARSVLGSTLTVDGRPHTVVGVAPREFDYPRGTEVWTPMLPQLAVSSDPPLLELDVVARLGAGSSPVRFATEIERVLAEDSALSSVYGDVEPVVRPFRDVMLGDMKPVVVLLFAGAVLLLVVAVVNVANLVLIRDGDRAAARAVRRALGASRARLAVAPVVEAAAITGLAGVAAMVIMVASLQAVLPLAPDGLAMLAAIQPDPATWVVLAGVLALSFVLLAAIPLARGSNPGEGTSMLRSGARIVRRRRGARAGLLAGQAGLALWAVMAAAVLVRSLVNLGSLDPGFDRDGLHVVQIDHRHALFAVPSDWPDRVEAAMSRLERDPRVTSATPVLAPPLVANGGFDVVPTLEGGDVRDIALPYMNLELTLPGYFETLKLDIVRGRRTDRSDATGAPPVVIVNEEAARALWPGDDPIGKRLRLPFPGYENVIWSVVGVARDARYRALLDVRPSLYVPMRQMPIIAARWIAVRAAAPLDLPRAVAAAFEQADPSVRIVGATSVRDRMAVPLARPRFALAVLGAIAGIVLLLSSVGTFAVMAAGVRSRRREIGVRMACGATAGRVGGLVLRDGLTLAGAGAVIGGAASVATGRLIESLLFGVRPTDPPMLAAAAGIVLLTAACSSLPAALRAARTDPLAVLRAED